MRKHYDSGSMAGKENPYTSRLASQFLRSVALKRDVVPSFDEYPFSIPAVQNLETLQLHPNVTFLIGENGTGKSTLLEAVALGAGMNPEGGGRNFQFATRSSHSSLHEYLRLARGTQRPTDGYFLRAESFYNVATRIDELDEEGAFGPPIIDSYGGVSLHDQSHGESFWALLSHRFRGNGLYFLDEPEAALSPTRQLAALARIHALVKAGSQFVIATHSPILMAYPHATILFVSGGAIAPVQYADTEHYRVTRDFLNHSDAMLKELLDDA